MRIMFVTAAFVLAATPGMASQQSKPAVPEATPAGKPVDCVSTRNIRETLVRDSQTIDFVMGGGKVYRNTLEGGACPQLAFEKRFMYRTQSSQLCSIDTITVLVEPNLTRGATCGLGKFQPVKLAK